MVLLLVEIRLNAKNQLTAATVFTDPPSGEDHEFIRRGVPYDDAGARQIRQLRSLGVTDVLQIPRSDAELKVKARCFRHGATSISSNPLCSWPLGTTRDECGECSIES